MVASVVKNLKKCRALSSALPGFLLLAFLAGCASTEMTYDNPYMGQALPKPNRILVYDFTANLNNVPANSPLRNPASGIDFAGTPADSATSQMLGAQIASQLTGEILNMGLPAARAATQTQPRPGDILLLGYFLALNEGSATQRMALGFGSGNAELQVMVEGYQMTSQGMAFLGSGAASASGSKTPGAGASLAVAIATSNPLGIIVGGSMKAAGEVTGKTTIEGEANRIAQLITARLQEGFRRQGWI